MARRRRPGLGRWAAVTVASAVLGAVAYETLKRRLGWRGWV